MSRDYAGQFVTMRVRRDGTVTIRPALPRRTRLKLAAVRRIDTVCDWLCGHGLDGAAVLVLRACGLWPSRG